MNKNHIKYLNQLDWLNGNFNLGLNHLIYRDHLLDLHRMLLYILWLLLNNDRLLLYRNRLDHLRGLHKFYWSLRSRHYNFLIGRHSSHKGERLLVVILNLIIFLIHMSIKILFGCLVS